MYYDFDRLQQICRYWWCKTTNTGKDEIICEIKNGQLLFMGHEPRYCWDHYWLLDNFQFIKPVLKYDWSHKLADYEKEFDRKDWRSWTKYLREGMAITFKDNEGGMDYGTIIRFDSMLGDIIIESMRVSYGRILTVEGLKFNDKDTTSRNPQEGNVQT